MSKPKVALYWCASCGGCEEAVVDLAEGILDVVAAVDIVFWPVALDFKKSDVEAMADGEITLSLINGAIRSSEQEEMVHMLRRKSQLVIAFGSCAHMGGIPGLANLFSRQAVLDSSYHESPSTINEDRVEPLVEYSANGHRLTLPSLWETIKTLNQVIAVDYYIPGCPPPVNIIKEALDAVLQGKLPERGSVLAPDVPLCDECKRRESKPEQLKIDSFKRPHLAQSDPEQCLLAQGFLCLGPVTRKGCGAVCIEGNMPCTGCMGPTGRVRDYGSKALSAFASLINANADDAIAAAADTIVDPTGTFYRYSMPASFLHRAGHAKVTGDK
jgi:F420-non-reducing hydrogenase small subunit